jgi:rubrerythrin
LTDADIWVFIARAPSKADKYLEKNPISANHVMARVRAATPEQFHAGMHWYEDAHHIAKAMAQYHDVPLHTAAGVIGTYSQQTAVAPNFHYASQALRSGKGIHSGSAGEDWDSNYKPFAGEDQAGRVDRMLKGEHYDDVLTSPKVHSYASLIHHPENSHLVVVDRHAVSAALGHQKTTGAAYAAVSGGLKRNPDGTNHPVYEHFANAYRDAAKHLTHELRSSGHIGEDEDIKPHQAQAISWIVQKQMNDAATEDNPRSRAMATKGANEVKAWTSHYNNVYGKAHKPEHPELFWGKASSRKTAYGETKAPKPVDTLRAENCTVCGNSTAFDGTQCQVCGYIAPPRPFGDPDTDLAKDNDMRKQVLDGDLADPNDPDQQLGNQVGDPGIIGEQAEDAEDEALEGGTALTCDNCGSQITPAPPQTSGGTGEPPYPAEGDVCPICKKGQLTAGGPAGPDEEVDEPPTDDSDEPDETEDDSDEDEPDDSDDKDDDKKKKSPPF